MGAGGFHGRVRDGIGCWGPRYGHQVCEAPGLSREEGSFVVSVGIVGPRRGRCLLGGSPLRAG